MTESPARRAGLRIVRWLLELGATGALTLMMVRLLYTTSFGISVVDRIPDAFWTRYHAWIGLEREGGVETLQDADAFVLLLACLPFALAVVLSLECLLRRQRNRND